MGNKEKDQKKRLEAFSSHHRKPSKLTFLYMVVEQKNE